MSGHDRPPPRHLSPNRIAAEARVRPRITDIVRRLRPAHEGFFAPAERRTLIHLASAVLEGAPVPIPAEQVADNIERFLIIGRSPVAWRVRLLLRGVEWAPFLAGYGRPFSQLAVHERRTLLRTHFIEGRGLWRRLARGRYLVLMGAYGDPQAANAETGFVPIPDRARLQALVS